jgi:hypothetical protein
MIRTPAYLIVVLGIAAAPGHPARAQTAPPSTTVDDSRRLDFSGTWVFDSSLSIDPAQIRFDAPAVAPRQENRGGRARFGSGSGRNASSRGGGEVLTPTEQSRLDALTHELKTSSGTLVISHHDPSFVVADVQDRAQFFHTNGVSDDNHVGDETVTGSAHWDGSRIVTELALSSRLTLTYTYTMLPRTNQLVVRVTRTDDGVQRTTGADVKLVYKLAPTQPTGSATGGRS